MPRKLPDHGRGSVPGAGSAGFVISAVSAILALHSCASVDAGADFRDTANSIRERTGSSETWEPGSSEEVIAASIDRMLADGALTPGESVRVALLSNPGLQSSFLDVGLRKADLVQAGLPRNPVLSVSGRLPAGGGLVNLGLSISQSLSDLLLLPGRKRTSAARLAAARARVVRSAVVLAGLVESECLDLIALQTVRAVADESLALAEHSRDLARSRFEAGLGDQVDVQLLEAAVLDARRDILVVERDRSIGRAVLWGLLGLEGRECEWRVAGDVPLVGTGAEVEALVNTALERRLDVDVASLLVEAARGDLGIQERSVINNIALGYTMERPTTPPTLKGPTIQGSLPIFSRNEPGIAKGQFGLVIAERNLIAVRQTAAREVRQAAARTQAAFEMLSMFEKEIFPAAKASIEASQRAWEVGNREILVVLAAQRLLVEQRRRYAVTLREAARAQADLDVAMGGPIGIEGGPTLGEGMEQR